jgi:integrase
MTYQNHSKRKSLIDAYQVKNILMITYMLGLRIRETLFVQLRDIDMDNNIITIRETKFFKSRLVPFNTQVRNIVKDFLNWRILHKHSEHLQATVFSLKSKPVQVHLIERIFYIIRKQAGIKRDDTAQQPRIHDLRHTFAVNRLTCWYRENRSVQQMLPLLSTYIGHARLSSTSVYLTMTTNLLQEANTLFEKYVKGGQNEK